MAYGAFFDNSRKALMHDGLRIVRIGNRGRNRVWAAMACGAMNAAMSS